MYKPLSVQARWDLQQEQMKYDDDGRRVGTLPREADRDVASADLPRGRAPATTTPGQD